MTEYDIDKKIKNYWAAKERTIPEDVLQKMEDALREFSDATEDNPVDAGEFLRHLDLSCLENFLNGLYKKEPTYPAIAMFKAMILMDLKKMKFFTELARVLKVDSKLAEALGFPKKDGVVLVSSDKNLWYFYNVRLKDHWDEIFAILRKEVVLEGKTLGLNIGENTVQDATPIRSLHKDDEAEYNDHYEVTGYKPDFITDLETRVPLSKKGIGINDDEGKDLIPQLKEMIDAGIDVKNHWIDGGYDDYYNLAWMGVHGITSHHKIHENWVHNKKGDISNLKGLYNQHWKDINFRRNADLDYILPFLFEKGYYEEVGSFFRNRAMKRYEENPEEYLKNYHLRSRQEGSNGYWKEYLEIEDRLAVKGLVKVDRYITRNMCSLLAVALCRLQHGVKENLTSIVYFT